MVTMALHDESENEPGGFGAEFKPLTAEQAQELRPLMRLVSPWRVIAAQVVAGGVVALTAWGTTGRSNAAWSAAFGALTVVIPAALFARGLTSRFSSLNATTAGFGFFMWEVVKITVSVGMLLAAPHLVSDLDWLALLVGLIVSMKMYWLALAKWPKRKTV